MTQNLPIAFQGKSVASAFKPFMGGEDRESLSDGIGSSYGTLHYKGKTWSLRYRGGNHTILRPDDGTAAGSVDVIILRQARVKSKSFYDTWDPNNSEGKRPICSSLDGQRPDLDVAQKQSEVCALCPKNEWKVNSEGRKVKDCTDYKRLAVLMMPNVTKGLLGAALVEPVFLRIPPASLSDLGTFGDTMDAQGFPFYGIVTRISFDPNLAHPKMVFTALQPLTDAEAPAIIKMREDILAKRITGEEVSGGQRPLLTSNVVPLPVIAAQPRVATTAVVVPPPTPAPQPIIVKPTVIAQPAQVEVGLNPSVMSGLADLGGLGSMTTSSPSDAAVIEGIGIVGALAEAAAAPPHVEPAPQRSPAMQTVADVGVVAADAALDARLAGLLPSLGA